MIAGLTTAFLIRAVLSGIIVAIISIVSRRYPGVGGLIASIPLVSTLGMIWLWRDTGDAVAVADYVESAFWYFLPTLPMFLTIPWMLRHGYGFWPALAFGVLLTILLYMLMNRILAQFGITL